VLQENVLRNQTELLNYKAVSVIYYECVYILALVTRLENRIFSGPYDISFCDLSVCTIFFPQYLINRTIFGKGYLV